MLASIYDNNVAKLVLFITVILGSMLLLSTNASAQAQLDDEPVIIEEAPESTPEVESATTEEVESQESELPENFEYTAVECNNLTLLVRRSIQIYDAETEGVNLSPAAIIYAETNVTQRLGSFQLDIGDDVSVPRDLVEQYAMSSRDLTPAQVAAWDAYTANVNFDLVDIAEPVNVTVAEDNTIVAEPDELSDQSPLTELEPASENDGASAAWWFVGIGAVLLLWYVLWRRPEEANPPRRSSK